MRRSHFATRVGLLLAVALVAGCGSGGGLGGSVARSERARLDEAQAMWAEADIAGYRLTWTLGCFCPRVSYTDVVVDGEVRSHTAADDSEVVPESEPEARTVDSMFDEVARIIEDDPDSFTVRYDDLGAVESYSVDPEEDTLDEEYGLNVELEILDEASAAEAVG